MKQTFVFDPQSGLVVPRARRVEAPRLRVCSGIAHQGLMMGGGPTTVAEAVSIYGSLVSWWPMDDNAASTTVLDSFGSNNMSTLGGFNTSSLSSSGFLNQYLSITSSSCAIYLPRANTSLDKDGTSDFSYGGWVKLTGYTTFSGGSTANVMGRMPLVSGGSNFSYGTFVNRNTVTPLWGVEVSSNGTSLTNVATQVAAAAATLAATWYLVITVYDKTNSQIRLYVNDNKSSGSYASTLFAGNGNFAMQQGVGNNAVVDSTRFISGSQVNECFFVNKALVDAECTYLYNAGAGKTLAQFKSDAGH